MGLVAYLIVLAVVGLIVGGIARLLLPGPDPIGVGGTIGVGLLGRRFGAESAAPGAALPFGAWGAGTA